DWSSDVCSSDSIETGPSTAAARPANTLDLFGGGPIITWGSGTDIAAAQYYELTGAHAVNSGFATTAWLGRSEGREAAGLRDGSIVWAALPDVHTHARIVD